MRNDFLKGIFLSLIMSLSIICIQAETLSVLTLNVWDGQNVFGQYTDERLEKICQRFKKSFEDKEEGWDVILIQELWPVIGRRDEFRDCGYPYYASVEREHEEIRSFLSGVLHFLHGDKIDTGLRILSRYPLTPPVRYTYSRNGDPVTVFKDGEAVAYKAAMLAQMEHPTIGNINLINTHLVSSHPHRNYWRQRKLQLEELASFLEREVGENELIIMGGDFNIGRIEHGLEPYHNPVYTWDDFVLPLFPSLYHATSLDECTYCPSKNMFAFPSTEDFIPGYEDQKIDHIFASHAFGLQSSSIVMDELFGLETPEGFIEIPYSDHSGVEAVFWWAGES